MVLSHQQFSFYPEGLTGHTGSVQLSIVSLWVITSERLALGQLKSALSFI
jgi:hypothetical protein